MSDMRGVIEPKSNQVNTDDLIGGERTITITRVTITPGEQPVAVYFEGDNGKPWKPCKSMSRVLVAAWGPDASKYTGKSCTLYRDPKVKWGGMEVGGIRVSHLSHIDRDMLLALTETRGKRTPFLVKVLQDAPKPAVKAKSTESATAVPEKVAAGAKKLMMSVAACATIDDMLTLLGSDESRKQLAYLKDRYPSVHVEVAHVIATTRSLLEGPTREPGED